MSELIDRFLDNLRAHAGDGTVTSSAKLWADLKHVIEPPAITTVSLFDRYDIDAPAIDANPTVGELEVAETGVTEASLGIARYGSVILQGGIEGDELISLYPTRHVILLPSSAIVEDLPAAISQLTTAHETSVTTSIVATGPSATADMGELVYGAHGPTEVHVLVVNDR